MLTKYFRDILWLLSHLMNRNNNSNIRNYDFSVRDPAIGRFVIELDFLFDKPALKAELYYYYTGSLNY